MDILSYSGLNNRFGVTPGEGEDQGWCLFSIEVRNTYGLPFEVIFERIDEGTEWTARHRVQVALNHLSQIMSWLAHVILSPQGRPAGV
jgi:hypothetical protein